MNPYHVTIENCIDQDDPCFHPQESHEDLDIDRINQNSDTNSSDDWSNVSRAEEQARRERSHDQSTAIANAKQTARIVEEAFHSHQ